jgi:uncharacterized membrane protein YiaA
MMMYLPIPALVAGILVGITIYLTGARRGERWLAGIGEGITGLMTALLALIGLVIILSESSEVSNSRTTELVVCLVVLLAGCLLTALGAATAYKASLERRRRSSASDREKF